MNKPFKYFIICNKSNEIVSETNTAPLLHHLQTWENTVKKDTKILKQTKTAYIDTRYEARLRLYNYINYIKKGLEIPKYKPFANPEIGKSIPILNF